MKVSVISIPKRFPVLHLEAESPDDKAKLTQLSQDLTRAQFSAIQDRKATRYNACGSCSDVDGVMSITVDLLLGGAPMGAIWFPDNDALIRAGQRAENESLMRAWYDAETKMSHNNELFALLMKKKGEEQ